MAQIKKLVKKVTVEYEDGSSEVFDVFVKATISSFTVNKNTEPYQKSVTIGILLDSIEIKPGV